MEARHFGNADHCPRARRTDGRSATLTNPDTAVAYIRLQEFTYLLVWEIPALPARPTLMPIPFPVPSGVTKGRKFRLTWISYEALAVVHRYIEVERAATAEAATWLPLRGGEIRSSSLSPTDGAGGSTVSAPAGTASPGRAPPTGCSRGVVPACWR